MTFLNPLILLGLLAAAIPIIIHLFNFRKPKKVDFSSLEFIKELQKSTMRRVRIRQWLLLLLRTLAIACIALAFARPTLQSSFSGFFGQSATSATAIVLDNSLSMTLRDSRGAFYDQASEAAAELGAEMEVGDEVVLIPTATQSRSDMAAFTSPTIFDQALNGLVPAAGSDGMSKALARAVSALEKTENPNKEIYIATDLQAATFLDSTTVRVPLDTRIYLMPVGNEESGNVAVTDVRVVSRIVEAGQPVKLEADVANFGENALDDYGVSVFLDGDRVAQSAVSLDAGERKTVSFTATPKTRGWLAGEVVTEDDDFLFDNTRYFSLHVPERRRILLVKGRESDAGFLELALSSRLAEGRAAFEVTSIDESALSASNLSDYDTVILVSLSGFASGELSKIENYLAAGGGMLIFAGKEAGSPGYANLMQSIGGGRFDGFTGTLASRASIGSFDRVDYEHPLFESVFSRSTGRNPALEKADVYFSADYRSGNGVEQTVIQLSNGRPFLQEIRKGIGTSLLFTVAPTRDWSELPVRGLFIPMLYRSMFYLSAIDDAAAGGLIAGRTGEIRINGQGVEENLRLVSPDGLEYVPDQRSLFGGLLLQSPEELDAPGVYDLVVGDKLLRRVAFNVESQESNLAVIDPEDAVRRIENATGAEVMLIDTRETDQQVSEVVESQRFGVELWNVFLALALILLVAEMLVAMQWRPSPAAAG